MTGKYEFLLSAGNNTIKLTAPDTGQLVLSDFIMTSDILSYVNFSGSITPFPRLHCGPGTWYFNKEFVFGAGTNIIINGGGGNVSLFMKYRHRL